MASGASTHDADRSRRLARVLSSDTRVVPPRRRTVRRWLHRLWEGQWVGIEMDDAVGKLGGTVEGRDPAAPTPTRWCAQRRCDLLPHAGAAEAPGAASPARPRLRHHGGRGGCASLRCATRPASSPRRRRWRRAPPHAADCWARAATASSSLSRPRLVALAWRARLVRRAR